MLKIYNKIKLQSAFPISFISSVILILSLILFLLIGSSYGEEKAGDVKILFLIGNGDGIWTEEFQQEVAPGGLAIPPEENRDDKGKKGKKDKKRQKFNIQSVSWKDALREKTFLAIPQEHRKFLLTYPEALFSSDNRSKIFNTDYVGMAYVEKEGDEWVLEAFMIKTDTGEKEYFAFERDRDKTALINRTMKNLADLVEFLSLESDKPVMGNDQGKLFHRIEAEHITGKGRRTEFKNPATALQSGYSPCPICFPQLSKKVRQDSLEVALGVELSRIIESTYRKSEDAKLKERVNKIGYKILKDNDLGQDIYNFYVLDTPTVNAYSSPPGRVYITRGLLEMLESDDEIAGVLSHEICHWEKHHAVKMFRTARTYQIMESIVYIATGNEWASAVTSFLNNFLVSGYSRGYETEADAYGIIYMTSAGYKPDEYYTLLKKFRDYSEIAGEGSNWFRSHPTDDQRLDNTMKSIKNLSEVLQWEKEIKNFDPGVSRFILTHPALYLEKPHELKKFVEIYKNLRFKEGGNQDYQLIPLDGQNNPTPPSEGIKPPESLNKGGK